MTPHDASGKPDHDDLTPGVSDAEQPQAEPEDEPAPKPKRTGSIAPPGAKEPAPEPPPPGGLLERIRRKLGR